MEFKSFGKIPRLLNMPMIISEKIDGTNAQIVIEEKVLYDEHDAITEVGEYLIWAGSRSRFIWPGKDNFGFANWVKDHAEELVVGLGVGQHFGEWWGQGIQRGYGLKEKRFSLFNIGRWSNPETRPACCDVVPFLYQGQFNEETIQTTKKDLLEGGSKAVPGYMKPEGVVIFLPKANLLFKSTFDNNDNHKGSV